MSADLIGIVIARGVPALMILLGFIGWTGDSIIHTITGMSAIPVVGCVLLIIGGVAIYVLELLLGV
jgi:hypothetical protein